MKITIKPVCFKKCLISNSAVLEKHSPSLKNNSLSAKTKCVFRIESCSYLQAKKDTEDAMKSMKFMCIYNNHVNYSVEGIAK